MRLRPATVFLTVFVLLFQLIPKCSAEEASEKPDSAVKIALSTPPGTVRFFDFKTKQVKIIPAKDLTPGMVKVNVRGIGEAWVQASLLKPGGYRNAPLSPEDSEKYLRPLEEALKEVRPLSLEEWNNDLRRGPNREKQLKLWRHIAETYTHFTKDKTLGLDAKKEIFAVIASCATNGKGQALAPVKLKVLLREDAEKIVDYYFRSPQ